jgi:hypothetical protein
MGDNLALLAGNPYLQGNAAFALTPEQKRDAMFGAIAHTLIGLGSGISRAGMGGQPRMAGIAPGFEMGANAVSADQNRMFQQNLAGAQFQQQEAYRRAQEDALKSQTAERWAPKGDGANAKPGFVKDGYRVKGGDPRQKMNWEPVP